MTRQIFVDTSFFVAFLHPGDALHGKAHQVLADLYTQSDVVLVSSDGVLLEVLAFFSRRGPQLRASARLLADELLNESRFEFLANSRSQLERAVELYGQRVDKSYSLTDCVSMLMCRDRGISEILTHDHDFEQEGFVILL